LQTDPVGYADSMNLYSYVGNNPSNYTDPKGLFLVDLFPGLKNTNLLSIGLPPLFPVSPEVLLLQKLKGKIEGERTKECRKAGKTIAVIGENVDRIVGYKNEYLSENPEDKVATFNLKLPFDIPDPLLLFINRMWIKWQKFNGREVHDIGRDIERIFAGREISIYFKMEREETLFYPGRRRIMYP